jgi:hypothetical protein
MKHLAQRLGEDLPLGKRTMLHYLDGKIVADLFLEASVYHDQVRIRALQSRCDEILADDPYFSAIHLHRSHAPE